MVHATVPAGLVSPCVINHLSYQLFYVLAGSGWMEIDMKGGRIVRLRPGASVALPPETRFRYRADRPPAGRDLEMLVPVAPRFEADSVAKVEPPSWMSKDAEPATPMGPADGIFKGLTALHDYAAPDRSLIWLLASCPLGGLSVAKLQAGSASDPVRHQTVTEIWYVLSGFGEIWRVQTSENHRMVAQSRESTTLRPGMAIDIPLNTVFQFRADGVEGLTVAIFTSPEWPGTDEAVAVPEARRW